MEKFFESLKILLKFCGYDDRTINIYLKHTQNTDLVRNVVFELFVNDCNFQNLDSEQQDAYSYILEVSKQLKTNGLINF